MFDGPGLPMSVLFISLAAIFVLRGPIGKGLAARLSGKGEDARDDHELQELRGEIEDLRRQLGEVQERLDFAERLLAQQKGPGALPSAGRG